MAQIKDQKWKLLWSWDNESEMLIAWQGVAHTTRAQSGTKGGKSFLPTVHGIVTSGESPVCADGAPPPCPPGDRSQRKEKQGELSRSSVLEELVGTQ